MLKCGNAKVFKSDLIKRYSNFGAVSLCLTGAKAKWFTSLGRLLLKYVGIS